MISTSDKFEEPFGPPPILINLKSELKNFIECPEKLPIHQLDNTQIYWARKYDVIQLLNYDLAPLGTTIKYRRDPVTGTIDNVHEINLSAVGKTSKNSMSMNRAPGPPCDEVKGNTSNYLFWPGGFEEPEKNECNFVSDVNFDSNFKTCVRGFQSGIQFQSDNKTPKTTEKEEHDNTNEEIQEVDAINLMNIVNEESNYLNVSTSVAKNESTDENTDKESIDLPVIDETITKLSNTHKIPVLKISESNIKTEWAEQLNVSIPVTDFHKKVPDPALDFPYELDTFQKQAIIKLEENCNVFVAAHTSAGKTTVAEYAIALSQKHMTRTIYTSPIKALSNQKFREFKEKFESVGLITGDIQINQTASCLIMTTEILQSMLYGASEVIRDLEYVIFDEVHYINNEDRGHVWEEIVILLPPTVTIVMLSATVPNPVQFADWVGKIKRRKMYVISTEKRPVPLQHFLYTGTDMKTKDNSFLIVDTDGQFVMEGWRAADMSKTIQPKTAANNKPDSKEDQKKVFKPKTNKKFTYGYDPRKNHEKKTEPQKWAPLLEHLITQDKLPVVVFTFSRNQCNKTAQAMKRHLITHEEKQEVNEFFKSAIKRLKDSDASLPQVKMIRNLLMTGIGIHHSGILPILKEIVEMLFQKGLVKMLFATETFAMGVNMPARTVIFDSVKKFDGNAHRTLHPTEYIQMAGRAGRRGHDPIGTVMIYCKNYVPKYSELLSMMCGKPQNLQSRFKVTYSMVLHLRRLSETISVKDMMRRSFGEAGSQHNQKQCMFELEQVDKDIQNVSESVLRNDELNNLYDKLCECINLSQLLVPRLMMQKSVIKYLKEDRVVVVTHGHHVNKLGIILSEHQQTFQVMILNEDGPESTSLDTEKSNLWFKMVSMLDKRIFVPAGKVTYVILTIKADSISNITNHIIKCDSRAILANWENRKLYKARLPAPNQICLKTINQLLNLSEKAQQNPAMLTPVTITSNDPTLLPSYNHMMSLMTVIDDISLSSGDDFIKEFEPIYNYRELLKKKEKLRQTLSGETMEHYMEYKNRIIILKQLGYLDEDERVTLKGRVALEMGTHELLLTELVLKNILTDWDPAEIAALLSALVFQKRRQQNDDKVSDDNPDTRLKQLEKIVQKEFNILDHLEIEYGLPQLAPINFELVYVVYNWAKQESFATIMRHTDIQEGIIVRCIQQLNETLRDVRNAAIIIGNPILKTKMEQASTAIKRDIVFAASLYTQD